MSDNAPTNVPPPAGWYPDSSGTTRYWDGTQWTENEAPPTAPVVTAPSPRNGLGIAGLILGIVGSLFGLVPLTFWIAGILGVIGLILAIVGVSRVKKKQATNRGTAWAGVVTSVIALILSVVGVVIVVNAVDQLDQDLQDISDQVESDLAELDAN
ncbi:MAG TPA: DUF2510 domain-containing protein [Jiangellaceae bacterium]|nr:DUF2510 domain-containing protein [Jiangellaceae bacterium]